MQAVTDRPRFRLRCPDCDSELVVDATTGEILSHRAQKTAPGGGKSFDSLFADLDAQKASAEDRFEQEKTAYADRERLLDEKFKEAMKRAEEEPDEPVRRPFEFD
jgi:hypothetical protein